MQGIEFATVDLGIIVAAICAAVPATIAAWAALSNGRQMRTNNGMKPGQYIEATHERMGELEHALTAHLEADTANFAEIREMLEDQNILSARRASLTQPEHYPAPPQEPTS